MDKEKYSCKVCEKKFEVELVGAIYPGCKEKEEILCPHCGAENGTIMTSQIVKIYKL